MRLGMADRCMAVVDTAASLGCMGKGSVAGVVGMDDEWFEMRADGWALYSS